MIRIESIRTKRACRAAVALLTVVFVAGSVHAQSDAPAEPIAEAEAAAVAEPPAEPTAEAVAEEAPPMVADETTKSKLSSDARFTTPPPSLDATAHDLLLLNSGEWLQGDIKGIRDDVIEFDSVELEDIEIDLEDVMEIHANRVHTYRFEGKRDILTGPARMNADTFVVGDQERPRSLFMAQVAGKPTELNFWNGDLSVGYSIRSGNTNQSDLSVRAELNRETALTRFTNLYNGAFSTADVDDGSGTGTTTNGTTANSHRLKSSFDYYVTNRLYLIVPAAEVFADEFQNINLRITPSAGVGLEWLKGKRFSWDLSASGGYTYTDRVSVSAGETKTSNDGVVILGTTIETDPTSDIEWDTNYRVQVVPADMDLTNHHLESIFSIDLFRSLDFDVTFIWDRIEGPDPIVTDTGPPEVLKVVEKNDYRLTFGVGWDF